MPKAKKPTVLQILRVFRIDDHAVYEAFLMQIEERLATLTDVVVTAPDGTLGRIDMRAAYAINHFVDVTQVALPAPPLR